jgi:hypothetical protein
MHDLSVTNNELKHNEKNGNKFFSSRNKIRLIKPKLSLKFDNDYQNMQFIKKFNSPKFSDSTINVFHQINPSFEKLSQIATPSVSMISQQNKNISFVDKGVNINLSLTPKRSNENKKDVIYNLIYDKKNRIEALNLKLHKDSIEEQEKEYQNRINEENKRKEKKKYIKIKNNISISEKKENRKVININLINLNDRLLFDKVDKELNVTLRQMNILNNEADLAYKKYKLRNNNINKSYNKNIRMIKNKFKIKNNKFFSLSPIAKNGFNILNNFNIKNRDDSLY